MSKYTPISIPEMEAVLKADKGWEKKVEPNSKEYIFEFPLSCSPHIIIRVCSSIKIDGGMSRDCGKDAIRVFAYDIVSKRGWIKTKRVYRVGGWKDNLRKTTMDVFKQAKARRDKQISN